MALSRMTTFYETFPDLKIVATLSHQLTWSHIIELLPLEKQSQRDFYAYIAVQDHLSVPQLHMAIHKMTYERSESSKQSKEESEQILSLLKSNKEHRITTQLFDRY